MRLFLLCLPLVIVAALLLDRATSADTASAPPSGRVYTGRVGDVFRVPSAAMRCSVSHEAGAPNLICDHIPRARYEVVFYRGSLYVYRNGHPDDPVFFASQRPGGRAYPPAGLTDRGRLLWNLEALLRQRFGDRPVSASGRGRVDFSCAGDCAPLATFSPYRFTFSLPAGSAFHVTLRRHRGESFGNYPIPVLVRGRLVACDRSGRRFLVKYESTASFTVGCLAPLPRAGAAARRRPVYLDDPGLIGVAVRPEYISFKPPAQTWKWIRAVRWRSWGGETARGRGLLETCTFGRCKRAAVEVRLWRRLPRNCPTGSSYTRITYVQPGGRARTVSAAQYVCETD